ncbi:MAG TPA: hypothetical protein PKE04_08260, partial [Clostridia bacterium]|nr:hypothetical protein [Clostridia bacterium]
MKKLRGPSMRLRHMLSYVLVAVIPLLVCAAIVTYANHVEGRQNILKGLTESLQTARARLDLQIKSLETVCLHFSSGRFSGDDSDAHGIAAQLRSYQANYPFVEFLAYLPRGGATLITPSGVSDYRALQQDFPTISLDLTQFYSKSHQLLASAMLYTRKPIGYTGWGDYLIYLHPVPMLDEAPTGTLAFFLNKQTYTDVILDCMGLNGYYAVMDANMNLLYDHDTPGAHPEVLDILAKMKGTAAQQAVVQGVPYVLLRTISESTGMYYMAAFPETTLFADLNGRMFRLCLLFLCAALAMGLLALWMGRRLFLPLQRLADDIAPAKTHPEGNLLERIRAVYQDVSGQNDLLQRQAQAHLVIARQQLLLSLLHGSYASTLDLTGQLRQAGVDPEGKMLTVIVARLEMKPQLSEDCLLESLSVTALPDGMAYAVAPEQSGLYTWVLVTPRPDGASQDALRLALAEQL